MNSSTCQNGIELTLTAVDSCSSSSPVSTGPKGNSDFHYLVLSLRAYHHFKWCAPDLLHAFACTVFDAPHPAFVVDPYLDSLRKCTSCNLKEIVPDTRPQMALDDPFWYESILPLPPFDDVPSVPLALSGDIESNPGPLVDIGDRRHFGDEVYFWTGESWVHYDPEFDVLPPTSVFRDIPAHPPSLWSEDDPVPDLIDSEEDEAEDLLGFIEAQALAHNSSMHSLNGNPNPGDVRFENGIRYLYHGGAWVQVLEARRREDPVLKFAKMFLLIWSVVLLFLLTCYAFDANSRKAFVDFYFGPSTIMTVDGGFNESQALSHNVLMHSLNGNIDSPSVYIKKRLCDSVLKDRSRSGPSHCVCCGFMYFCPHHYFTFETDWTLRSIRNLYGVSCQAMAELYGEFESYPFDSLLGMPLGAFDMPKSALLSIYCLYRTLSGVASKGSGELFEIANVVLEGCMYKYGALIEVQGFGSASLFDLATRLTSVFSMAFSALREVSSEVAQFLCSAMTGATEAISSISVGGVESLCMIICDALRAYVSKYAVNLLEKVVSFLTSSAFFVMMKTALRSWLGYSNQLLLMEIVFDRGLLGATWDGLSLLVRSMMDVDEIEVQGVESVLPSVLATIALSLTATAEPVFRGAKSSFVADLLRNITTAARAENSLGVGQAVKNLLTYLGAIDPVAAEYERLKIRFPGTISLFEFYQMTLQEPQLNAHQLITMQYYYSQYLDESKDFLGDRVYLSTLLAPALSFVKQRGLRPSGRTRLPPPVFLFAGRPGQGKSSVCSRIADIFATRESRNLNKIDPKLNSSVHNFLYAVDRSDKYMSGYNDQTVWLIDDWLQFVDVPGDASKDITLLFDLCTTKPIPLNMAAVEDKGKLGRCHLVVASTNIAMFEDEASSNIANVLRAHTKSILDSGALRRRISYVVKILFRDGYSHDPKSKSILDEAGRVIPPDTPMERLYMFRLFDTSDKLVPGPNGENWTWSEFLQLVDREYKVCRDYVYNSDAIEADLELISPQGLLDYFLGTTEEKKRLECECNRHIFIPAEDLTQDCMDYGAKAGFFAQGWQFKANCVPNEHPDFTFPVYLGRTGDQFCTTNVSDLNVVLTGEFQPKFARHFVILQAPDFSSFDTPCVESLVRLIRSLREGDVKYFKVPDNHVFKIGCMHIPPGCYSVSGVSVWDVPMPHSPNPISLAQIGAGLLALVTIGAGVAYLAKSLYSRLGGRPDGEVITVGDQTYVKCEDTFVEPQGRVVMKDAKGRSYVAVKASNGTYRIYAQGMEPPIDLVLNRRFSDQLPVISNNIYAVVNGRGELCGNILALNEYQAVAPQHIARQFLSGKYYLKRDDECIPITPPDDSLTTVELHVVEGHDLAVVVFHLDHMRKLRLVKARDILSKFCARSGELETTGEALFVYRDACGKIQQHSGAFYSTDMSFEYSFSGKDYKMEPKNSRLVDVETTVGMCGGLYLHRGVRNTELILGLHVGYNRGRGKAVCLAIQAEILNKLRSRMVAGPGYPPEIEGVSKGSVLAAAGATASRASYQPARTVAQGRVCRTLFPDLSSGYAPAALAPFFRESDGEGVVPLYNIVRKLHEKSVADRKVGPRLLEAVAAQLDHCKPAFVETPLRSWADLISSECGLPSIDRTKSAGHPWCRMGSGKGVACIPGVEIPTPTPEFVAAMEYFENMLVPDDFDVRHADDFEELESVCTGSLKDEPRPVEKVLQGKTRLFTVAPLHEFLLQRKYFLDLVVAYTEKNLIFSSALGIDPDSYGSLHAHLARHGPKTKVASMDFVYMDGSFTPLMMHVIARLFIGFYGNEGKKKRLVHPDLPPLNRANFMRWQLLLRLAHFKIVINDDLFVPGVSHPSGSFLTTILNIACQQIIWVAAIADIENMSCAEIVELIPDFFLGDDSNIGIPEMIQNFTLEDLSNKVSEYGFQVTSDKKEATVGEFYDLWEPGPNPSEYCFLSRHYAKVRDSNDIVGVLTPDRLFKMLAFCDKGRMLENFPMTVLSFLQEIQRWERTDSAWVIDGKAELVLAPFGIDFKEWALLCLEEGRPSDVLGRVTEFLVANPKWCVLSTGCPGALCFDEIECQGPPGKKSANMRDQGAARVDSGSGDQCEPVVEKPGPATGGDDVCGIQFADNKDTEVVEIAECDREWMGSGMDVAEQGHACFRRPFQVASGAWASASTGNLWSARFPTAFFDNNFNAQAKLTNFAFLGGSKATINVKVVLGASPFAAGALILWAGPPNKTPTSLYELTAYPHVLIDAASGKNATISIPWILPQRWSMVEYYDSAPQYFDVCRVTLTVLDQVSSAAAATINYTVFAWLEDTELHGPTITDWSLAAQGPPGAYDLQEGKKPSEAVHGFIKTVGGVLTEVVKIVEFATEVAAMAGFSVPCGNVDVSFMNSVSHPTATHMYGTFPGIKMATYQGQKTVLPAQTFGIFEDDMNIAKICSRSAYFAAVNWPAASVANTSLMSWNVTPCLAKLSTDTLYWHVSPLSYVANMFRYWRGSIIYTFVIPKTAFHAGSLEIMYSSGVGVSSDPNKASQRGILHRIVWDIQDSHVLQIRVPYQSAIPWTPCSLQDYTGTSTANALIQTGQIFVNVLNPLTTASGNVSDNVNILCFISGGPDIEFNHFACIWDPDKIGGPLPIEGKGKEEEIEPQGRSVFQVGCETMVEPIEFFKAEACSQVTLMSCFGERIDNLRAVAKRFGRTYTTSQNLNTSPVETYFSHAYTSYIMEAILRLFAFVTGGWRVSINTAIASTYITTVALNQGPVANALTGTPILTIDGVVDILVDVPWVHFLPFIPISDVVTFSTGATTAISPSSGGGPLSTLHISSTYNSSVGLYRRYAAADDFCCGWQIGVPGVTVTNLGTPLLSKINNSWA